MDEVRNLTKGDLQTLAMGIRGRVLTAIRRLVAGQPIPAVRPLPGIWCSLCGASCTEPPSQSELQSGRREWKCSHCHTLNSPPVATQQRATLRPHRLPPPALRRRGPQWTQSQPRSLRESRGLQLRTVLPAVRSALRPALRLRRRAVNSNLRPNPLWAMPLLPMPMVGVVGRLKGLPCPLFPPALGPFLRL
jgi:hypothetical protein